MLLFNNSVYYVSSTLAEWTPPLYVAWEERWPGHNKLKLKTVLPSAAADMLRGVEVGQGDE